MVVLGGAESSLSQDVDLAMLPADDDDDDRPDKDPFIPQERIFAKYAAMLYTSDNNGRTFHELKDAKYCASCGEKVRMTSQPLETRLKKFLSSAYVIASGKDRP